MNNEQKNNSIGMYDPSFEHDACGMGFVADVKGRKSRSIIDMSLDILLNLEHRGAVGADIDTGDGSGILIQMPDAFLRKVTSENNIKLPPEGKYGVGVIFLPQNSTQRKIIENVIEKIIIDEDQKFLGWRDVPVDLQVPGKGSR
ncbi:MAG: hypothetical protein P4L35_16800, partial [Ignavibacteriaceae bacterium]|nr:hypothetical protein [Ignavibacteriaceae bacterium]